MIAEPTFKEQQKTVDDLKSEATTRVSDDDIQAEIDRLSKPKSVAAQTSQMAFRPLVALKCREGEEIKKEDLLALLKNSSFPNKRIVVREVMAGRAKATMKNGSLSLEHL